MGGNITVPYSGQIAGGVTVGTDVVISGRTSFDFRRFSINLCTGPTMDSDVIFHFNPRFDNGRVVRNHKQGGSWGLEEADGGMPFRRGHTFELHIKVEHTGYKVTINNHHFCHFNHRLPKESVQFIYIEGNVEINFIQFRGHTHHHGGAGYPSAPSYTPTPSYPPAGSFQSVPSYPPAQSFPSVPSYQPTPSFPQSSFGGGPIFNPPVPLTTSIPGGLYPGRIIYISGVPSTYPSRFTINLACGAYDSADHALTFDARFNYGNCRNVVVRTHKQGGTYGPEERQQNYFPFTAGVNFEIMILVEPNSFKIAVNNQHFTEFFHRIQPLQRVEYLNIVGDVNLTQVRFQ